ncbi:YciI family protein [Mucilaginibacter sp.]
MKQYLITGYDYTDSGANERRMNARPHHLDNARELKEKGRYLQGGAILNGEGTMIGSVMMMQFESDEELEAWKRNEPYVTQKVWETVDVKPFKLAVIE